MTSLIQQFYDLRPAGGFGLIMADPPWSFDNFAASGEAKNAKAQYACMDLAAIKAMPVGALAADDAVLWLWATNPMLLAAAEQLMPDARRLELFSRQRRLGWSTWGNESQKFGDAA